MENEEIVITFDSTSAAMAGEDALLRAGVPVRVMGLPAAIRAGCGIALRVDEDTLPQARAVLARRGLIPAGWYRRLPGDHSSHYEEIPAGTS